ncbi:PSME3-interacting protein-like [Diadema antillarum]|uniref:PSME3-interacting protein-like n=1 Tax=Diadema antillarum TaxID=105358 RepID=UPI003A850DD3
MASANLKAFVSESELQAQRQRRQEEWEKVRTADQPEECPEEEYDPRSLFEKLQEQKDKKQSDYDEQFKFKNMIRGIDEDESNFLNDVAEKQMKIESQRLDEEKQLINECKETIMSRTVSAPSQSTKPASQSAERRPRSSSKRSQAALLAGAVKRKKSEPVDDPPQSENPLPTDSAAVSSSGVPPTHPSSTDNGHLTREGDDRSAVKEDSSDEGQVRCIAVLPGIGTYSNSSEDSDSDSSDSEGVDLIKAVFHKTSRRKKSAEK